MSQIEKKNISDFSLCHVVEHKMEQFCTNLTDSHWLDSNFSNHCVCGTTCDSPFSKLFKIQQANGTLRYSGSNFSYPPVIFK